MSINNGNYPVDSVFTRARDASSPLLHEKAVTVGWDSIGSGVDEVELIRPEPRIVPKPVGPDDDTFDRLDHIAGVISQAKRDARAVQRIFGKHEIDLSVYVHVTGIIADQTMDTVRQLA
jgi:hypothetical protein